MKANCTSEFGKKKIDVTFDNQNHNGIKCVELVNRYLDKYEALKYLVLPLKQLLFLGDLNDPYKGGLTSYGLILMIVSFIQEQEWLHQDVSCSEPNLGVLMIKLLQRIYAINYTIMAPKTPDQNLTDNPITDMQNYPPKLFIIDPLKPDNDVGNSVRKIMDIKVEILLFLE